MIVAQLQAHLQYDMEVHKKIRDIISMDDERHGVIAGASSSHTHPQCSVLQTLLPSFSHLRYGNLAEAVHHQILHTANRVCAACLTAYLVLSTAHETIYMTLLLIT